MLKAPNMLLKVKIYRTNIAEKGNYIQLHYSKKLKYFEINHNLQHKGTHAHTRSCKHTPDASYDTCSDSSGKF